MSTSSDGQLFSGTGLTQVNQNGFSNVQYVDQWNWNNPEIWGGVSQGNNYLEDIPLWLPVAPLPVPQLPPPAAVTLVPPPLPHIVMLPFSQKGIGNWWDLPMGWSGGDYGNGGGSATPEPGTFFLMGLVLFTLVAVRRLRASW